jgi:hypothetical protein
MITRQFGKWTWKAITPSEYHLIGHEKICARFNGRDWHLCGIYDEATFEKSQKVREVSANSMQHLSDRFDIIVQKVAEEIQHGSR